MHVESTDSNEHFLVKTSNQIFKTKFIFDSRIPSDFRDDKQSIQLLQHFKGWFVEFEAAVLDPDRFVMMDYSLPYESTTSFIYMLPQSDRKGLIEYTFFSENLVEEEVYDSQLNAFMIQNFPDINFNVLEEEKGVIPMTDYNFSKHNKKNWLRIGAGGGWIKPSTGYSFRNTGRKIDIVLANLKEGNPLDKNLYSPAYLWMDRIFLKVLKDYNSMGPLIFEQMYSRNKIQTIFKFLDEKASFWTCIRIIASFNPTPFVKSFLKILFNKYP